VDANKVAVLLRWPLPTVRANFRSELSANLGKVQTHVPEATNPSYGARMIICLKGRLTYEEFSESQILMRFRAPSDAVGYWACGRSGRKP
jgi:hypothetical protein